jgi:hypothetical protein
MESLRLAEVFATGTEMDFRGDSIVVVTPGEKQAGKYLVVKEDKSQIVIVTDKDGKDDLQTFTFIDERTMKWAAIPGKSIMFRRQ